MKKNIYISHLFPDEESSRLLKDKNIGLEIIDFGIGYVLDEEDNGIETYYRRMGKYLENRNISLHGPFLDLSSSSFDSLIRNATMVRYNQVYKVAKSIKADRIVFHSCYYDNIYFKEAYIEKSVEFWKEYFKNKCDDDIKIHIENVYDKEPSHLIEIIDKVDNKSLSVCLDIGHINCYSELSIGDWIRLVGARIGHIHLHNNDGNKDTHSGLNNGNINIDEVLDLIDNYCINPSITVEVNNSKEIDELVYLLKERYDIIL